MKDLLFLKPGQYPNETTRKTVTFAFVIYHANNSPLPLTSRIHVTSLHQKYYMLFYLLPYSSKHRKFHFCGGRIVYMFQQECIPVGCVPAAHWPYAAVCFAGGCLLGGAVSAPGGGGLPLGGCLLQRGCVCVSQHALRQTPSPPPVDRILDTRLWKYYLGPTSLRPVIRKQYGHYHHNTPQIWKFKC